MSFAIAHDPKVVLGAKVFQFPFRRDELCNCETGWITLNSSTTFDMKMGSTHIYATAISAVDVFTTEYPAFSSNLIIDRSFFFVARSLASSALVS